MKKTFTILFLTFLFISLNKLSAQVLAANYTFSSNISTYTTISNGNVLGDDTNDDNIFDGLPIGFTFTFCGVPHTSVSVCSNGYIKFGHPFNQSTQQPISNSSADDTCAAALGADLASNTNGALTYTTIGTAPNQIFIAQWEDYTYYGETDNFYFQIRLHQTSNVIEVFYGSFYCNAVSNAYEVGLRGNSFLDYNNRSVIETINTWPTSVPGTSQSNFCMISSTPFIPANGQRYVWSPPCPAPNITVTASQPTICVGSSVTFTANGATSYTWNTSSNANTITTTPSTTATYTVIGTSVPSCTAQVTCTIGVVQGPSLTVVAQPQNSFCPGQTGTLVASGANNGFTWTPGGSTFAIILVAPTSNITYTITGANTEGCTSKSLLSLFMTTCTSIYDPQNSNDVVSIYPNPSNGSFVIELANGSQKQIDVIDLTGRVVLSITSTEDRTALNISDLPNAVYYVRLRSNNETSTFKIVKE